LFDRFEPVHGVTYFAPEVREALDGLGYKGYWMGYFAARSAPLGQVAPEVVTAIFYNFASTRVAKALPAAWQIAEAHSRHAPTYLYRYDYATRTLRWSGLGATHATELLAVFDVYRTKFGRLITAAADRRSALRVSDDVQSSWRAFARTGVPGDDWPAYTTADRAVKIFDRRPRVEYDPHAERRQAWEGFSLAAR